MKLVAVLVQAAPKGKRIFQKIDYQGAQEKTEKLYQLMAQPWSVWYLSAIGWTLSDLGLFGEEEGEKLVDFFYDLAIQELLPQGEQVGYWTVQQILGEHIGDLTTILATIPTLQERFSLPPGDLANVVAGIFSNGIGLFSWGAEEAEDNQRLRAEILATYLEKYPLTYYWDKYWREQSSLPTETPQEKPSAPTYPEPPDWLKKLLVPKPDPLDVFELLKDRWAYHREWIEKTQESPLWKQEKLKKMETLEALAFWNPLAPECLPNILQSIARMFSNFGLIPKGREEEAANRWLGWLEYNAIQPSISWLSSNLYTLRALAEA